jgi:hypothetical protein
MRLKQTAPQGGPCDAEKDPKPPDKQGQERVYFGGRHAECILLEFRRWEKTLCNSGALKVCRWILTSRANPKGRCLVRQLQGKGCIFFSVFRHVTNLDGDDHVYRIQMDSCKPDCGFVMAGGKVHGRILSAL